MQYTDVTSIKESRSNDIVWRRLAQFHDIERTTTRILASRPEIPEKQRPNVKKQVQQISYSLTQAREFFRSAESTGQTIRALLAYYGVTSLANAEILWWGNGDVSFDRRPTHFNAHGLEIKASESVDDFAALPARRPDGSLTGLFGLWRKYAHHLAQYATITEHFEQSTASTSLRIVSSTTALDTQDMPDEAISLLDCLSRIPAMRHTMAANGLPVRLARGSIRHDRQWDSTEELTHWSRRYLVQPNTSSVIEGVMEHFKFPPAFYERVDCRIPPTGGFIATLDSTPPIEGLWMSPEMFSDTEAEMFFIGDGDHLNEFGYLYVGLYIASMLTRYHPNVWIKELQGSSIAATLVDEFVDHALVRAPMLLLGSMEQTVYLFE